MSNLGTKIKRTTYKIKRYLFTPIFKFNRVQFNLIGIFFIFVGLTVGGIGIVPRIFALNETQYIIAQGGNTDFSTGTPVNVSASSTNISLAKNTGWYSLNWNYKKTLTIKNTSTATLNANSAMSITIDTSTLESVLSNCNDLRVIYQGTTELPLTISREPGSTNCNDSKATVLTFPIQANLTTGASDSTNYFLYYGNSSASSQGSNGYSIPGGPVASMVCSFKSSTTCETGQTPTTESGAIRYSGTKSAMSFDGKNDVITVSNNLGSVSNFTLEGWVKVNNFPSQFASIINTANNYPEIRITTSGGSKFEYVIFCGGSYSNIFSGNILLNTWYHVAGVTNDGTSKLYINGTEVGTPVTGCSQSLTGVSVGNSNGIRPINGVLDDIRISDVARYTSNFTPSTSPFVNDTNTKLLFHFDENGDDPRNTGKAIDSSGIGNHGTISGAKYVSGLVGVDKDSNDTGKLSNQTYASHSGVFIEEGTTNLITNPSFEHGTYNTNWASNYLNYGSSTQTFTPNMSKRNSAGPFAAGPMIQGKYLGGEIANSSDNIYHSRGTQISGNFYSDFDTNQGSIVMWITPEWNGNDNQIRNLYVDSAAIIQIVIQNNILRLHNSNTGSYIDGPSTATWTVGTTYNIIVSWDVKNSIDGTNKVRFSVNGSNTYSTNVNLTSALAPGPTINVGSSTNRSPEAIYEGVTVYRRVLYDGTYGTNIGNGNEISQIYNSGTGKDPTEITGSWDVVFALPTNASTGALTTGTGNAWSHPHSSNLIYTSTTNTGGFMMNGTYGTDGWVNVGSPSSVGALSTSEMIFAGGYKYTSTGANQGIYTTFTASNGGDYVLRALGNSDGTCNPQVKITRADGTTEISHLNGNTTSTKGSPDAYIFTWESQAAESNQVQLLNTASSGTCYWHQVEVYLNNITNPSVETGSGTQWTPTGWGGFGGANSGEQIQSVSEFHSGGSSLYYNIQRNAGLYQFTNTYPVTSGSFYAVGSWAKVSSGVTTFGPSYGDMKCQNSLSTTCRLNYSSTGGVWSHFKHVGRYYFGTSFGTLANVFENNNSQVVGYFDDLYVIPLNSITLTVTPASQVNSTETSGLRVDGADTLTQSITGLSTTNGIIRFKYTPRHSAADVAKFGDATPWIARFIVDGSNYIDLKWNAANTIGLDTCMNATCPSGSWNATGGIIAGTTYNIEINYIGGGNMVLKVDGTTRITLSSIPAAFSSVPTTVYWGTPASDHQADATFSNFTTSTITQNSTSPYMKFGSNSVKLVNGGTLGDEYTTSINVGNTNAHMLSAYVYDETTGNIGGIVSNTIAELYYNNSTITTTYTDMGGGWWRLNGSLTGVNQSALYGVQVKAGKTIYLDGVQLEAKTYPTTYADGSLGTGYSWSGTTNNSNSIRVAPVLSYSAAGNIDDDKGTISLWFKPNFNSTTPDYSIFNTNTYLYNNNLTIAARSTAGIYIRVRQQTPSILSNSGNFAYSWVNSNWYNLVLTYQDGGNVSVYANNAFIGSIAMLDGFVAAGIYPGNGATDWGINSDGAISDFRIFNQVLTTNQISDLYYQGVGLHSQSITDDKKYQSTGTWESPVINLGQAGQWGASTNFDTVETLNGNTVGYETKTSNDGNTWSAYASVTGSGGGYDIQSPANKYIQIKTTLNSSSQTTTPVVSSEIVNYVQDAEAPITNGVNTLMKVNSLGRTVPESGWTNDLSPYFQWDLAEDNVGGSGIKGYCLNLSQTPGENPATTKGLLGTSPISTTGSTCQFIVGTNNISFDDIALRGNTWLSASTDQYYLSIKAIDNTGNIFPTSEVFDFKFDDIPPTNVTSFSTPQNSFANVDDIYFNWPANGNGTASDSTSGLLGYQFAINNETTWLGDTHENTLNIDYIPLNFAQPFYLDAIRDGSYFQIGNNTVYLRAIDTAGNKASISRTALVSYGGNAPSFSNGSVLTITPSTNTSNMYAVSWPAATPANGRTVTKYYYMINTTPPATLSTMLNNSSIYIETTSLSIPNGPLTGAIKGSNTIYVVAIDDLLNYSPSNALSASFTLDSSLPDPVKNLSISDASVKSASLWRVSLAWEEPDYKGTGLLTYKIQRSTDNSTWSDVSTTTGNAYVDTVNESKRYYWRVGSMDTTNTSIASPSYALSVTFIPKGSYTSEAPLVSGPSTSDITTRRANISWVTGRTADSRVTYGIKSGEYFNDETANSRQVTNHVVTLTNLLPATTYFYKARWTDEDGNLGESNEQSFTTSDAPSIKDVQVKSVGINFAQIKFTSKGSTRVKIYYGKTALFGGVTEVSTSTNESTYTVILEGLDDGTKYYYRINPYDIEDTEYEGTVLDLKTYPRPKIYSVNLQQIRNTAETSIQVSWISNTDISSLVTYYPEGKVEQSRDEVNLNLVSGEHKITLKGLLPDTKYVLVVKGLDRIGNEAKSDPQTFTTATDTRAPKITEVLVETYPGEVDNGSGKKNSQIIVSWKTDEPATSKVEYGEGNTDIYEFKTPEDDNLKLNHVVIINNLDISKIYHLRAISLDKAKNESKSQDVVTITAKTQDNAFDLIFKNIRNIFNF